jgi:hypothetical protein
MSARSSISWQGVVPRFTSRRAGTETGNVLIVVWYGHSRRETSLAAELGGQVAFIYKRSLRHRALTPLRYLVQSVETWQLLDRAQPSVVIVQTPPIAAALPVALWCHLHRRSYGMDCHTGTFYGRRWSWALPLLRVLAGRAAVTIAASEAALRLLRSWGRRAVFLADGLPSLSPPSGSVGSAGQGRVAVISSFDPDEPVAEVFAAARLLPHVRYAEHTGEPAGRQARQPGAHRLSARHGVLRAFAERSRAGRAHQGPKRSDLRRL